MGETIVTYQRTEEQLQKARVRRLAHYHANKHNPEYRKNRAEKARVWRKANPEKQKAAWKRLRDKQIKEKGIEGFRASVAARRRRIVDSWRKRDLVGWKRDVWERNIIAKFNMSVYDYAWLEYSQDYKCAVC